MVNSTEDESLFKRGIIKDLEEGREMPLLI